MFGKASYYSPLHHHPNPRNNKQMIITLIPKWIEKSVLNLSTLTYNGEEYKYAVVVSDFGIKNGIAANFTIAKDGVLAVSEACPQEYRDLYLIHEIIESDDLCRDHGVCLRALKEELRLAEKRGLEMDKYVKDRLQFFVDVAEYYNKTKHLNQDCLAASIKIGRSLLYLRNLKIKVFNSKK